MKLVKRAEVKKPTVMWKVGDHIVVTTSQDDGRGHADTYKTYGTVTKVMKKNMLMEDGEGNVWKVAMDERGLKRYNN